MDQGLRLRTAREARGLSLEKLARATRVKARILDAIEQNDARAIPPRPYGRGFVRAYAAEVGLDPDATVREFFAQFAPIPEPPPPAHRVAPSARRARTTADRHWWTVMMVLVMAVVAATVVIAVGRRVLEGRADPGPVATAGVAAPAPASTVGTAARPAPVPAPTSPLKDGVVVVLEATRPAWVSASVDGRRAIYRTLKPGEREQLKGSEAVRVRVGDAGAIRWQVNGGAAEAMGRAGEVRTALVTPPKSGATK